MTIGVNTTLRSKKNKSYTLGREIGAGGEGRVFEIPGQWMVAKIYKKVVGDIEQKLTYMVDHPVDNLKDADGDPYMKLAWPQDILYDDTGAFVGYIMPFIEQGVGIFNIARGCDSAASKAMFPRYTRVHNVVAATNLARAVAHLHAHGYIIGDMNSQNILVGPKCCVIILDNDSFDITDPQTGHHFKCTAGTQEYLAPELQGRNLRDERSRFTAESDNFSLAIHIFQLLMNNFHPFTGKNLAVNQDSSVNQQLENIQKGRCPFVRDIPNMTIPVQAPYLVEMVTPKLVGDFCRSFTYDETNVLAKARQRVTAQQWVNDLSAFLQLLAPGAQRVQCPQNATHIYISSQGKCGLCAAQERYNKYVQGLSSIKKIQISIPSHSNSGPSTVSGPSIGSGPSTGSGPSSGSGPNTGSGLKPFLWVFLLFAAFALLMYSLSEYEPDKTPSSQTQYDENKIAHVTGTMEPDTVGDWETSVYVLSKPIVGCLSMTVDYSAEIDGGATCRNWSVYVRTQNGWEELGTMLLSSSGTARKTFTLDGSLYIEALTFYPNTEGSLSWSEEIDITDVVQTGVMPSRQEAQQPQVQATQAPSGEALSGYYETHNVLDWSTSVWMLNSPIRNRTSVHVGFYVEMTGSIRCEEWRVYARIGNGSWRQIDTLTVSYDANGEATTDKVIYLDSPTTIDAIGIVPKNGGNFSWVHGIAVYDD